MKKLLTLALALAALAVFTGLSVGQDKQKVLTGKVTQVNDKAQTFAVTANGKEVNFSGKNLKPPFPKVGDFVDVTYTDPPKAGDPPAATTVKGSKSNGSSFRMADDKASPKPMIGELTGKVTGVDSTAKTFTVIFQERAITFSAAKLSKLPTVGKSIHIAFTANPGELPMATSPTGSGSNAAKTKEKYEHCGPLDGHFGNPISTLNVCY